MKKSTKVAVGVTGIVLAIAGGVFATHAGYTGGNEPSPEAAKELGYRAVDIIEHATTVETFVVTPRQNLKDPPSSQFLANQRIVKAGPVEGSAYVAKLRSILFDAEDYPEDYVMRPHRPTVGFRMVGSDGKVEFAVDIPDHKIYLCTYDRQGSVYRGSWLEDIGQLDQMKSLINEAFPK